MTTIAETIRLARTDAVILERPGLGAFAATGEDRQRLLHNVLTNEVAGLKPGEGREALLLDHKGRTLADLHLLVEAEQVRLLTEVERLEAARAALDGYVIADDVELTPLDEAVVSIVGRGAAARAEALGLPAPASDHAHAEGRLAGHALRATRLPLQALPSVDLVVPRSALEEVARALAASGLPRADAEAAEILRVEAGRPRWGRELGPDVIPLEARMTSVLHPSKGCYVGQETIVRAQARGRLNWGLWGLALPEGAEAPAPDTRVLDGERAVGRVTSAVVSPTLGHPIALARLRREVSEPGRRLALDGSEQGADAAAGIEVRVVELPFET